jgi:hypothetical protein
LVLAAAACLTSSAVAWEAIRWGDPNSGAWVPTADHKIRILAPGTYKFYATTGSNDGVLADFADVFVDPNIPSGAVTLTIARDPNYGGGAGCTELGALDLTAASSSVVAELRVAGDAATQGPIAFGTLQSGDTFHVGGNVIGPVTISTLGGHITCGGLGNLTVTSSTSGAPVITVGSDYAGTMIIDPNGPVSVGGLHFASVSGSVTCRPNIGAGGLKVAGDVTGSIDLIGYSTSSTGGIYIDGSIAQGAVVTEEKGVDPNVYVGVDVAGTLNLFGPVAGTHAVRCQRDVTPTGIINLGDPNHPPNYIYTSLRIDGDLLGRVEGGRPGHGWRRRERPAICRRRAWRKRL